MNVIVSQQNKIRSESIENFERSLALMFSFFDSCDLE